MRRTRYRITPACAGNRYIYRNATWVAGDHPRVCGEQLRPAVYCGCTGDHPRVCGEQSRTGVRVRRPPGSPPRVRGTAISGGKYRYRRITPACAGNRCILPFLPAQKADHPRVCGEQFLFDALGFQPQGSPPRVRGTAVDPFCEARVVRITPACAGNRADIGRGAHPSEDHPRVCGEQRSFHGRPPMARGSPPRVRGTEFCVQYLRFWNRITPACAGNRDFP